MWGRPPTDDRQQRGRRGEALAAQWLVARGYTVIETNVRFPVGEIDIVAQDGPTLCFVEVRSASSQDFGGALASVGSRKQRHLIRAGQWYLQRLRCIPAEIRFDVVAIEWRADGEPRVELVQGAFAADER